MRIQPLFIKQLAVFSALVGLANALFFQINMIGFFVFALFTLIMSYAYGHTLFKKYHLILGFLFTVCTFSVAGSIIYYTLPVTTWTLLLIIAGLLLPALFFEAPSIKFSIPRIVIKHWAVFLVGIIGLTAWWATILQVDITDAVRSPWSFIDPIILLGIALAAGASTLLLYKKSPLGGILTGLTVISAAGLAWAAYSIGYGFDPFIHKATLEHIVNFGSIDPKPFYYIGDYAIELIARLNFGISIQAFNTVFVPILGMMIMTASVFLSFKHSAKLLILFLLPIGAFISTTPQALSYAFAASIAFLSFRYIEHRDIPLWILWMLAITSAIIHPLSGIPALIFLTLLSFASLQSNAASTALITLTSLAGAVSIPTIFLLQASLSHLEIHTNFKQLFMLPNAQIDFKNHFDAWLDLFYFFQNNLWFILAALFICGCIHIIRTRKRTWMIYAIFIGILTVNYHILSTSIEFSFLVEYERLNYTNRLLILMHIFALPVIAQLFSAKYINRAGIPILLLIMIFFSGNAYTAYPRDDGFVRERGFNVSMADIDAVWAIHEHAGDADIAVLANQAVSAAALQEFGFKKYYSGDIFYYPIPTGGELYHLYLRMVDEAPSRAVIDEAHALTGAETLYFVLNDYWWNSDKIFEDAKQNADDWFAVHDESVTIFIYYP